MIPFAFPAYSFLLNIYRVLYNAKFTQRISSYLLLSIKLFLNKTYWWNPKHTICVLIAFFSVDKWMYISLKLWKYHRLFCWEKVSSFDHMYKFWWSHQQIRIPFYIYCFDSHVRLLQLNSLWKWKLTIGNDQKEPPLARTT